VLIRFVNHIKLGWCGERFTDAKAYLAVAHEQRSWRALMQPSTTVGSDDA